MRRTWAWRRVFATVLAVVASWSIAACGEEPPNDAPSTTSEVASVRFSRVDGPAGVRFLHFNDASSRRRLPETMGAGVAFADFDGDGWADLFFVNGDDLEGKRPEGAQSRRSSGHKLFRNQQDGSFADVTPGSGLDVPMFGMGVASGDIDHDGAIDLFVSAVGQDRLFRNLGDGRFEDATESAGLLGQATGFASSVALLDYDRDGDLDLFTTRYVQWTPETDRECRPDGLHRAYCTPETYDPIASQLWRNDGDGTNLRFADVSRDSGIAGHLGKGLGVLVFDHDGDGWDDLLVANDTERNFLFHNQGDGTFVEIGVEAGIAFSESGAARGGMGIDGADLDRDGFPDVIIGNFSYEMAGYFRGRSTLTYLDEAPRFGIGLATLPTLAFGLRIADLDSDGDEDVVLANGHIDPDIAVIYPDQTYAQPAQVFLNRGRGFLQEVEDAGDVSKAMVGRGLAMADFDLDGDPDLVITQNGAEACLFRNDGDPGAGARDGQGASTAVRVHLVSANGSVTPYGARVRVKGRSIPGGVLERRLRSGGSYLSSSEPVCTLAWPCSAPPCEIDSLLVTWPTGHRQVVDPGAMTRLASGVYEIKVQERAP